MLNFADINDMGNGGYPGVISAPNDITQSFGDSGLPSNASLSEVPNEGLFDDYDGQASVLKDDKSEATNVEWFYNQIINAIENQMKFNQQSANRSMDFEAIEAEKNRQWQKMMSDSAYQRAVEDMKKAGLNPTLIGLGSMSPASTPSGSMASGSHASISSNSTAFNGLMDSIFNNFKSVASLSDTLVDSANTIINFIKAFLGGR